MPVPSPNSHSLIEGFPADGDGNLPDNTDPLFVDPRPDSEAPTVAGDYRLMPGSPLIDAGSNAATTSTLDFVGEPRVQDGDGNGTSTSTSTIDIGAHEAAFSITPGGDVAEITDIAFNASTGQVTLTVEAAAATTYTIDYSTTLSGGSWNPAATGSLSAGSNTIPLTQSSYAGPHPHTSFRVTTP